MKDNRRWFIQGLRDGIPITLGYLAVSFALGIAAKNAGFSAIQALVTSATINASAGEFVGFSLVAAGAGYLEILLMEAVANARYLLMSCSLSQKLAPTMPFYHRLLIGYGITDEIFGASISVEGKLNPYYAYGLMASALPGWSCGTFMGVVAGNIMPARLVSAFSVGLFGMFLSIIITPARKNKIIAGLVVLSFVVSYVANRWDLLSFISSGIKTILLTVIISLGAAILFPLRDQVGAPVAEGGADHAEA